MPKKITSILALSIFAMSSMAQAEVKDLAPIMKKASATQSLASLLEEITMVPATDPQTGKSVFKVTKIKKGSIYEKEGIKAGDLVIQ